MLPFLMPLVIGVALSASTIQADHQPTQTEMLRMATRSETVAFSRLPHPHKVSIEMPTGTILEVGQHYLGMMARGQMQEQAAYFDPSNSSITISSEELRLEGTMPDSMRPNLRHALRHEYGHAFLYDMLVERHGGQGNESKAAYESSLINAIRQGRPEPPPALPSDMHPLLAEYAGADPTVYGSPYLTSSFGEYFAESYARVLEGKPVPAQTKAWFLKYADEG